MDRKKYAISIILIVAVLCTAGSYWRKGPSRRKFKKLPGGVVDLTTPEVPPEAEPIKEIVGEKRLITWADWWKGCSPGFTIESMDYLGQASLDDESIPPLTAGEIRKGPARMFYIRSPGGKRYLNPYWSRLLYKKAVLSRMS